jgi:hypothetical protein
MRQDLKLESSEYETGVVTTRLRLCLIFMKSASK